GHRACIRCSWSRVKVYISTLVKCSQPSLWPRLSQLSQVSRKFSPVPKPVSTMQNTGCCAQVQCSQRCRQLLCSKNTWRPSSRPFSIEKYGSLNCSDTG